VILADQSRTDRAKPRSAAIMALAVMIGAFEFGLGLKTSSASTAARIRTAVVTRYGCLERALN